MKPITEPKKVVTRIKKPKPQVTTNKEQGKRAEKEFEKALRNVMERLGDRAVFERIPDTGDVAKLGRTLPPRRSDFDAMFKGSYFMLEVKCCSTVTAPDTLPIRGTWSSGQLSAAARFSRAGAFCFSFVKLPQAFSWFICPTSQLASELGFGRNRVGRQRLFKFDQLEKELEDFFYDHTV